MTPKLPDAAPSSTPSPPPPAAGNGSDALAAAVRALATGAVPDEELTGAAFRAVMDGGASDAVVAALLMGLRCRGETPASLVGAVRAIRERMLRVGAPANAIDVAGTGGDGRRTLNVSTAVAFVLRGCGVPVAKHGNHAVSSRSGAADVLAALGLDHDPPPAAQTARLAAHGIAFLHAPRHHPAMRHAAAARRALGVPTLLNLAGPLCNPAGVRRQLLGVFDPVWLEPVAEALRLLGAEGAWVVHGDGLDELTLSGESAVAVLRDGIVTRTTVTPEDAGLARAHRDAIRGGAPADNARALEALLGGAPGPYRDTVLLNAAAALVVADRVVDLRAGAALAAAAIDRGDAAAVLARLRDGDGAPGAAPETAPCATPDGAPRATTDGAPGATALAS